MDGVLVPPNMNVISVQWTPFGAPFTQFEVDFSNSVTDVRVLTKCSTQTWDTGQPPMQSGGCELIIDPDTWALMSHANRGGDPVKITVRGTTDGMCASASASVNMSFASEDLLGAIYYWKSTVSPNGVGGQIWVKSFGDSTPEKDITSPLGLASCTGCHALSRDGLRMVINNDDDDSDDEYSDVQSSLVDFSKGVNAGVVVGGTGGGRIPGLMDPSFATFYPDHSQFLITNGKGTLGMSTRATNVLFLYDGTTDMSRSTVMNVGATGQMATMPDWSPDGKSVVFVIPQKTATWNGSTTSNLNDDDHIFGGNLYTMPYMGNGQFGPPKSFLMSNGENNYYPSYSPDGQFVVFDRAPHDTSVATIDGCNGTAPQRACPNDSFSNPAARLMLVSSAGGTPIDLENANGSTAASPVTLSNSWPRWSPFLQQYKGNLLLWVAFSSTRDYGVRVRNHKPGMYQCYPADSYEDPGAPHHQPFQAACQQPQLWMAAINLSAASGADPSRVAFWLPFQDIKTHNHTPQWTQAVATTPPPPPPPGMYDAGSCIPSSGDCHQNPGGCCSANVCAATGKCVPIIQ
jgi:hypothetical protein